MAPQRIHADMLIPGAGEPVERGCVVIDDGVIVYAGPVGDAPPHTDGDVIEARTVMPGLWDCHAHFTGVDSLDPLRWALEPLAAAGARAAGDARAALRAGVTSVREVGAASTSHGRSTTTR